MSRVRTEIIGDATLYLGDCREILPTLERVDAVVTDPPYGIGQDRAVAAQGGKNGWRYYGDSDWDAERPCGDLIATVSRLGDGAIIWGGNYFSDILPARRCWLSWDKGQLDFSCADFELAWTSLDQPARRIFYPRALANGDGREHPTQKPLRVMEWCLGFLPDAQTILDPFMGSGTTGVACIKLGRKFIGIEIEERYFDIACRRIEEAWKQPRLFDEPRAAPVQEALDLEPQPQGRGR